jgi:hypothetical protein
MTVVAIWTMARTIGLCVKKLATSWKKPDSHENPFGSVKASGSLPT